MNRRTAYYVAGVMGVLTLFTLRRLFFFSEQRPKKLKAVFFGDSITQHGFNPKISGWLCHFANWWTRRVDVINRGFSGYNSKWGVMIVDQVVLPLHPDIVFVFFGANDAVDKSVGQHVPLNDYASNIRTIITKLRQGLPEVKLVLISPPPIWEPKLQEMNKQKGKLTFLDRTNERTLLYVESCKQIGKEMGVPVVDTWAAMEGPLDKRADFLSDGLHLSSQGNERLFKACKRVVLDNYPSLAPEAMHMHMNEWAQMIELDRQLAATK